MVLNGIEYCDKCHTPKCLVKHLNEKTFIFPIRCDCEEEAYQKQKQAEEKIKKEAELRIKAYGLRNKGIAVKQYHNWTLDNDDNKTPQLTAKIKTYINGFEKYKANGKGLLLYGSVGTGKTYYAMCIANALIDKGYKIYATSLSQVVRLMRDYSKVESKFKELMSYELIVLDDLGTESDTPMAMEIIQDVIDGWTARNIPLIVTTNLPLKTFEEAKSGKGSLSAARLSDRLLEKCYPIKVNAVKRRDAKSKANIADMDKDFK